MPASSGPDCWSEWLLRRRFGSDPDVERLHMERVGCTNSARPRKSAICSRIAFMLKGFKTLIMPANPSFSRRDGSFETLQVYGY